MGINMLETNILWTGRAYYSLENCWVREGKEGTEISSTIVGMYADRLYKVAYSIRVNGLWEVMGFEVQCQHTDHLQVIRMEGDGKGNWLGEGKALVEYEGCIDIDLPLTPFTNTLPIRRLRMEVGQEEEIKVLYLDLLAQEIRVVRQRYRCLTRTRYHYENVPNDFEADIEVDEAGLVVDYPGLFVRTMALTNRVD